MNRPAGSETRKALGSLHQKINTFAREKDWIHSAVFTLLTLVLLFFCGTDRILIIVFAIAVFAEVIPPLIRYGFDIGDLADLFTNLLGMGIGLMIWKLTSPLFSRWIPWLRKPATS
jgi:glycopeptide antibiotics resistance protein